MNTTRSLKRPRRIPRLPRLRLPEKFWVEYSKQLKTKIIDRWKYAFEKLIPRMKDIERQVELDRPQGLRKDSWSDEVASQLSWLSNEYDKLAAQSADIAAGIFDNVNHVSHAQWYKIAKQVMGVNLFQYEPWVANESKAFIHMNVDLATKVNSDLKSEISRIVMGGFREGRRWETISKQIIGTELEPGVFNKIETRADLIARDQTTKLYGQLGEKRQENAGIEWYIWRTMKDERVVGNPSGKYPIGSPGHHDHYVMEGKVCKWNDATVYAESIKDAKAGEWKNRTSEMPQVHPGAEIQDRCYAEPIFDTLFM